MRTGEVGGPAGRGSQRAHLENISGEAVTGILSADKMCQGNPPSAFRKQLFSRTESRWLSSEGPRGSWLA